MVFATDFDPVNASARRQTRQKALESSQHRLIDGGSDSSLANSSVPEVTRRSAAQGGSVYISSPASQTNRLLAKATLAGKLAQHGAAKQSVARRSGVSKRGTSKVRPEAGEIAIAPREPSTSRSKPNVLAPLPLPKKTALPLGLRILNRVQHTSTALTGVLMASALVLYGSSVYVDKSANRAMAHLNFLQDESQQLTSANEAIKQTLANQATQDNSGLEPYESGDVLFVEPAPAREPLEIEEKTAKRLKPLGY